MLGKVRIHTLIYIVELVWVILTNSLIRFSVTTHRFGQGRNVQWTRHPCAASSKNERLVQETQCPRFFFLGTYRSGTHQKHHKTVEQIVRMVELSKAVRRGKRVRGLEYLCSVGLSGGGGGGGGRGYKRGLQTAHKTLDILHFLHS
jgi:hypothetical protein